MDNKRRKFLKSLTLTPFLLSASNLMANTKTESLTKKRVQYSVNASSKMCQKLLQKSKIVNSNDVICYCFPIT